MPDLPMPHKVLESLENRHGDYCIDIFARADGTFGFEEYRSDPEDCGKWFPLHRYGAQVFDSEEQALARAKACVAWLRLRDEKG
jgi:hypothetical protein